MRSAFHNLESPFLSEILPTKGSRDEQRPGLSRLAVQSPFERAFQQGMPRFGLQETTRGESPVVLERETAAGLEKKLVNLSFFPHSWESSQREVPLKPVNVSPGIYDGLEKFQTSNLQPFLDAAMKKLKLPNAKVALVDLTKGSTPEFAGFHHQDQATVVGIPKMAVMLAAFQLRHDLRSLLKDTGASSLDVLFSAIRDKWVHTQIIFKTKPEVFTRRLSLQAKLVLLDGKKVALSDPKSAQLDRIFAAVPAGNPVVIDFSSTGEDKFPLEDLAKDALVENQPGPDARRNLLERGFKERLQVMMDGAVPGPVSDLIASSIVRAVGYPYIVSTLLQSGLYDPNRGGGLWLGSDYGRGKWRGKPSTWKGALAGGSAESATAGALAAFMTLLAQDMLVDPQASAEMRALMQQDILPGPRSIDGFKEGLEQLPNEGSLTTMVSMGGHADGSFDDCAFVERTVDTGGRQSIGLRYVAVGLRARNGKELKALILELDNCILSNNGLPVHEIGAGEIQEFESDGDPAFAQQTETEPEFPAEVSDDVRVPPLALRRSAHGEVGSSPPSHLELEEEDEHRDLPRKTHVTDTFAIPFRWVCKVAVRKDGKYDHGGSGLLISDRHVLTAAHVVYDVYKNRAQYDLEVTLALDGNSDLGTYSSSSKPEIPALYEPEKVDYDYALITLDNSIGEKKFKELKGDKLCFWGSPDCGAGTELVRVDPKSLVTQTAYTAGYPKNKGAAAMWSFSGLLAYVGEKDRTMTFTGEATEGQSGSPVWVPRDGKYILVGVLVARGTTNRVVRVTRELCRQLAGWIGTPQKEESELERRNGRSVPSSRKLTESMKESLESPFLTEEVLAAEPHHDFAPKIARLTDESPFATVSIQARTTDQVATESETNPVPWTLESEQSRGNEDEAYAHETPLEENEFRVDRLPAKAQAQFSKTDSAAWRDAVAEAIGAGVKNPKDLADIIFFMQHRDRIKSGVGKPIAKSERDFFKLRAEWNLYSTIVTRILKPSTKPTVFLPGRASRNYEDFVAAPTTGRITLMVHGRNSDGSGHINPGTRQFDGFRDELKTLDRMEETVESLGAGDSLFIANWQFVPTQLVLTADPSGSKTKTWGDLLAGKANEGVKIRVIIAQHPPFSPFMSDLAALDAVIALVPAPKRDNFKYIVSAHPHFLGVHHQKFIVARNRKSTVAFCGGLDISFVRAPQGQPTARWGLGFVWHDVGAKLEGLIAHDLEREFVEHWNREKDKSSAKPLDGWKGFEKLAQVGASEADKAADLNKHPLQMLRTVSVGPDPSNIRRDDTWLGYFRLIGRATRFIYLENQYLQEPKLADAIVKQAESQPELIVIVMVGTGTDDRQAVDPKATGPELAKQRALVDATQNAFALRLEFFKRLSVAPLTPNRLRVYTLNYSGGILHSKLILVDDEALSVGSANANPRGFFFDTELNVMLDHAETVRSFRERLWAHNLGVAPDKVAKWSVSQFFDRWDAVAKFNQGLQATPTKMVGEGVIPFKPLDPKDPRFRAGKRGPIHLPFGQTVDPTESLFELDGEARGDDAQHPEESGPWHEALEGFDETGDVAFEKEVPLPRGVPNFEHFFQPTKPHTDGLTWVPDGDEKKLEPLNPGFVDDKDALVTSAPLQSALNDLLTGKSTNAEFAKYLSRESVRSSKSGPGDKIRVALVDLTGRKMTRPEFAGWGSTVAIDAGSATKVAALYAIFQVKTDLEHVAKAGGISKTADLIRTIDERWKKAGIKDRPTLSEIFNGDANPPHLAFAEDVQDAIENIVFHEANVAASLLIRKIGFPYIASLMWRSGLRHPSRGGLWLLWNFDDKRPQQWDSPVRPSPGPVFPHTATALSLATFFTLMAQGRLASKASSEEMKRRLTETWYQGVLPAATFSAKVGLLHNEKCVRWEIKDGKRVCAEREVSAAHEADYIENGRFRYTVTIMTVGIPDGIGVLRRLIVELDSLIQKNNP